MSSGRNIVPNKEITIILLHLFIKFRWKEIF